MKKVVSLVLVFLLLLPFTVLIANAEDVTTPETEIEIDEYVNIDFQKAQLIISGVNSTSKAELRAKSSVSLSIVMELQKIKSGSYSTIETWTNSGTGTYLSLTKTRLINVLATYRLKVTFTAGGETAVVYAYP